MIVILCTGSALGSACPDQRVAALVVGDDLALLLGQQHALALRAGHDPVDRLFQRGHGDLVLVARGR